MTPSNDDPPTLAASGTVKLTKAQRILLHWSMVETLGDGSGKGTYIWGRHQMRTANSLEARGLIYITPVSYARITDLGRAALRKDET